MSEKIKNPNESSVSLANKAEKLMNKKVKFWIRRHTKNLTTGEVIPGRLEKDWQILNIDNSEIVTMYKDNEVFHTRLAEIENLNKDLFDLADQL